MLTWREASPRHLHDVISSEQKHNDDNVNGDEIFHKQIYVYFFNVWVSVIVNFTDCPFKIKDQSLPVWTSRLQ